jgi:hypothetical protein
MATWDEIKVQIKHAYDSIRSSYEKYESSVDKVRERPILNTAVKMALSNIPIIGPNLRDLYDKIGGRTKLEEDKTKQILEFLSKLEQQNKEGFDSVAQYLKTNSQVIIRAIDENIITITDLIPKEVFRLALQDEADKTVFISYAREDSAEAERLYRDLKKGGAIPWIERVGIKHGERWEFPLHKAIKSNRYFIPLFSSRSVDKKGYVNKELRYALEVLDNYPEKSIFMIPVRLDDCEIPFEKLKEMQNADLFPDWNDGVKRIFQSMRMGFHIGMQEKEAEESRQADERTLERYPDATFPKRILIGESALLRVVVRGESPNKIDQPELSQGSGIIPVATDGKQEFEDILVGIDPQSVARRFEVKDRGHRVIHVPVTSKEDSKPVFFELVAKGIGYCNIVLEFIQKSEFIGNIELTTEVIPSNYITDNKPEQAQQQTIALSGAWSITTGIQDSFPYDYKFLGLIIRQSSSSSRYTYDVLIQRGTDIVELDPRNPTLIKLENEPEDIFRKYFTVIENTNIIPRIHDEKVRSIGKGLYEEIFPQILKDFIWQHRDEIKHIHVLSKEPWIPWEIMVPFEGSEEDEFLCQRYNFSRFLAKQPIRRLQIKKAKIIGLPNSSALKDESNWLTNTFSQANHFDKRPASTYSEVIEGLLKKGGYQLLHFSSHGQHDNRAPMLSTISLENDDKISPNDLLGSNSKFGQDHPLVILNSCQSARQAYSITGIQSWVTNFINAGAAAVIGTTWSIDEESAVEFTKAFYTNLSKGNMTVAEAVHKTRLDCKKTGNPTWLAYVYYGSPASKIMFGA